MGPINRCYMKTSMSTHDERIIFFSVKFKRKSGCRCFWSTLEWQSPVLQLTPRSQCRLVCRQTTSGPRRCHVNQNETCGGISPERPALVPVIRAVGAGISRWWGSWGIRLSTAGASTTGNLCVLNRCAAGPKKIDWTSKKTTNYADHKLDNKVGHSYIDKSK